MKLVFAALIGLLGLTPGCALIGATAPKIEVARVELRGLGVLDQALDVLLCVSNPNDAELSFRRVRVGVDVAGLPLAESESDLPVRLPGHSATLVPFSVATTARNAGPQLMSVLQTGTLQYRMRGSVQLDGGLTLTLPFSRSGELDLLTAGSALRADRLATGETACTTPPR